MCAINSNNIITKKNHNITCRLCSTQTLYLHDNFLMGKQVCR